MSIRSQVGRRDAQSFADFPEHLVRSHLLRALLIAQVCGNLEGWFGKHRIWHRFDIKQSGIRLKFEGSWTRFVSMVLVSMDVRTDGPQLETREVAQQIYRWQHDSPDVVHPLHVPPVPSDKLAEILALMTAGIAFRFSVTTSEPLIAAPACVRLSGTCLTISDLTRPSIGRSKRCVGRGLAN